MSMQLCKDYAAPRTCSASTGTMCSEDTLGRQLSQDKLEYGRIVSRRQLGMNSVWGCPKSSSTQKPTNYYGNLMDFNHAIQSWFSHGLAVVSSL